MHAYKLTSICNGNRRIRIEKVTADDVAEVRDVVHIRQGASDEDVALARDWELRRRPIGISHD